MRDKKMDGFNSNEDAPEYNQLSFARGADARRNGKDLSDNPFPNHCWVRYYRKSWDAGWCDQDMDMGCAVEASFLNDVRYIGAPPGTVIKANSEPLNPRPDLANKIPTGFSWGYLGAARRSSRWPFLRTTCETKMPHSPTIRPSKKKSSPRYQNSWNGH